MQKNQRHTHWSGVRNTDSSFTYKVIYISYGENTTSGVVLFRSFSGYKCQDFVHTHGPSGEYQDLHMCLKAARLWAIDYIIKVVIYGNSLVYYACKYIIK